MQSRSVFSVAFLWWLIAAALLGALYPLFVTVSDALLTTGSVNQFDDELWRAVINSAISGLLYGVAGAAALAGIAVWQRRKPRIVDGLSQLLAGSWTIAVVWLMAPLDNHLGERVAVTSALALTAWALAPAIVDRYRPQLGTPDFLEEARPPTFRPIHMLTSTAHSDDVEAFVRSSLRTHGRGNAMFTLSSASTEPRSAHTEVLIDSSGTGHVLNLAIKKWESELASGAEQLAGFVLTDDRSLAIAPAGLSAPAVVSEGIALVQSVSGDDTIKVQFDGFGH